MSERSIIVIGHKNPDTDSICAAIAYAHFKTATGTPATAFRAGNLNGQTSFVLNRFGVEPPPLLTDVFPRVRDIMIGRKDLIVLKPDQPIGRAFDLMLRNQFSFLPVVDGRSGSGPGGGDDACVGKVTVLRLAEDVEHIAEITSGTPLTILPANVAARSHGRWLNLLRPPAVVHGRLVSEVLGHRTNRGVRHGGRIVLIDAHRSAREAGELLARDVASARPHSGKRARGGHENGSGERAESEIDFIICYGADSHGVPSDLRSELDGAGSPTLVVRGSLMETVTNLVLSTPVSEYIEEVGPTFLETDLIRKVEREINRSNVGGFIVHNEHGELTGVMTRVNFLSQTRFRMILVDHNELIQAVDGADQAEILEVIDHHRIGVRTTETPITFINKVVGSTCSIIAEMYRNAGIVPPASLAGLMLSALLSDTVILKSPTATDFDREMAEWLAGIAGVEIATYGEAMFAAGSELGSLAPDQVIRQDQKVYEEAGFKFAVSQIETVGFQSFFGIRSEVVEALEAARTALGCHFACLLVTDITRETSLFVYAGEPRVANAINYPSDGENIFEMAGVLSRKKQLLPYLLDILKSV